MLRGILKRAAAVLLCLSLGLFSQALLPFSIVKAVAPLENVRDTINGAQLSTPGVTHDISFTLPVSAQQVVPSDRVVVELTDFSNVTPGLFAVGGFGNPNFSVLGNRMTMTGYVVLPGATINILGVTATNPGPGHGFSFTVSIVDSTGVNVRNSSSGEASQAGTFVDVSASVSSVLSTVAISGYTSPSSFVTITEDTTPVGTVLADGTGHFQQTLSALDPGQHTFRISSTDTQSNGSSQAILDLFLLPATLTNESGILLSPTFTLDKTDLAPGDTLTASGFSKPNSQINFFTESPLRSYSATSDASGIWSYTLPSEETQHYVPGQYRAYANVQDDFGNTSIVSNTLNFNITSPTDTNNPAPACDISHGDLNCDGKTNLTDFSILLFHWRTNHKLADINGDGAVNLVDFSIMMFYFKR
jgi:hypothetical protein